MLLPKNLWSIYWGLVLQRTVTSWRNFVNPWKPNFPFVLLIQSCRTVCAVGVRFISRASSSTEITFSLPVQRIHMHCDSICHDGADGFAWKSSDVRNHSSVVKVMKFISFNFFVHIIIICTLPYLPPFVNIFHISYMVCRFQSVLNVIIVLSEPST